MAIYEAGILGRIWRGDHSAALDHVASISCDCVSAVISSVVPAFNDTFISNLSCKSVLLTPSTIPKLTLRLDAPEQVGVDRLVCALGVLDRYDSDVLIVDSGTAITFCLVNRDGHYFGGSIFPGMGIASRALNDYTAQIPLITVERQLSVVGRDTKTAVEAGLYHGYVAMINGMIARYKAEWPVALSVVGTGGGLDVLRDQLALDAFEPDLIFDGLKECAEAL